MARIQKNLNLGRYEKDDPEVKWLNAQHSSGNSIQFLIDAAIKAFGEDTDLLKLYIREAAKGNQIVMSIKSVGEPNNNVLDSTEIQMKELPPRSIEVKEKDKVTTEVINKKENASDPKISKSEKPSNKKRNNSKNNSKSNNSNNDSKQDEMLSRLNGIEG